MIVSLAKAAEHVLRLKPIGVIHSPFLVASGTPIQPRAARGAAGAVTILPAFVPGLKDLDGFDRIWLIYWFHHAHYDPSRLIVIPFLDDLPRGVFATRAPTRPNVIGLSAVRLVSVRGNELHIRNVDILDGTPLLDIKPYVPQFDSFAVARCGWLQRRKLGRKTADWSFELHESAGRHKARRESGRSFNRRR